MNGNKSIVMTVALCLRLATCFGLGDQAQPLGLSAPKFVPLEIGEESLAFAVRDENTTTELTNVSFWGSTAVSGICREDNDSVTAIHLAYTQKIKIKQQEYKSVRYPGKELCVVEKTNVDGTVTDGLLMPVKLVICGIEKTTKDEKAWFLGKIDQLVRLEKTSGEHSDVVVAKHIDHLFDMHSTSTTHAHHGHKAGGSRPYVPGAVKVLEAHDQQVEKKEILLEKQTGAMEQKTILRAVNDLLIAVIGVFKALFEAVRGLFF